MTSRLVLGIVLATIATVAQAELSNASKLVSCVGREYVALQPASAASNAQANHESCLLNGGLIVCRRLLDDTSSADDTMAVSIRTDGTEIQGWREKGDPSYLANMYAFRDVKNKHLAVVATQQSETQGMGVQEWEVNVVSISGRSPGKRVTFNTAEFGASGTLVRFKNSVGATCHLLSTHWETRSTPQGDRLFLVGQLLDLQGKPATSRTRATFSRRFDRRLEHQREAQLERRPLVYFEPQR